MSSQADDTLVRAQPRVIPPTQAALEALAHTREAALFMRQSADRLLEIAERDHEPPEMHTIVINDANNGRYTVTHRSRFTARSIAILNPTAYSIYVGIGGVSATPNSRAPAVPPQTALVLPVIARDIELGADPAALLAVTAVVFIFQYLSLQPLSLTGAT